MQPVQLSLLPEEYPAPPLAVVCQLPETEVAEAIRVLAHLIAKAATGVDGVAGDE
jgi:hypothetical protein